MRLGCSLFPHGRERTDAWLCEVGLILKLKGCKCRPPDTVLCPTHTPSTTATSACAWAGPPESMSLRAQKNT